MSLSGLLLRVGGTFTRFLQFICASVIVGIFAYFIDKLRDAHAPVADDWRAVLGISGAAAIYTLCGIIFTLCLGGNALFGNLAVVLDVAFIGAFIYVSYATRAGSDGCSGVVSTPLGNGPANKSTGLFVASSLRTACQLNTACFAMAIASCVLFFVSAIWQFFMVRNKQHGRFRSSKMRRDDQIEEGDLSGHKIGR